DATVNAEAKAGKRPVAPAAAPDGDAKLRDAFAAMIAGGLDDVARINPRLVAIGSAPKEHTLGGTVLATGWDPAWNGQVKVSAVVARTTPSGTTGWVTAKVGVQKPGYVVPFTLTCIFDKQADGAWSLVHIQFAV